MGIQHDFILDKNSVSFDSFQDEVKEKIKSRYGHYLDENNTISLGFSNVRVEFKSTDQGYQIETSADLTKYLATFIGSFIILIIIAFATKGGVVAMWWLWLAVALSATFNALTMPIQFNSFIKSLKDSYTQVVTVTDSASHADEISKLAKLHEAGSLTDAEFEAAKKKAIGV